MSPRRRDPERDRQLEALAAAIAAHPRSSTYELSLMVTAGPGPGQGAPAPGSLLLGDAPGAGDPRPLTCDRTLDLLKELERTGRARHVPGRIWRWETTR